MRSSKALRFYDFSGGLNTKAPVTALELNQALDLQNINLLPSGGFVKRFGNSVFNSSAMVGATTAISGLGYFRKSDATDSLVAVAGTKLFASASLSGTMSDVTGSLSITTGQDNIWTCGMMNNLIIFAGGAPDAPFTYSGTGNGAALAGSPPSGNFIIVANNRAFIGNTSANPSRIAWSILGSPSDWTGAGSGTQDVNANDGDVLIGATQLGPSHLLLFKQNSIWDLVIQTSPFPLFPLFRNVGAVSRRGIVTVDGITYFITPQPRMKATDGTKIMEFPDTIDNVWDGLNKSRLSFFHGVYYPRLRQIWWFCSNGTSTTHNYCIIWDLQRKCWLRHTTGYGMNVSVIAQDYLAYGGAYDGKVYKQDVATTNNDASETAGTVNAYWRSGWMDLNSMIQGKSFPYVDLNYQVQSSGTFNFAYGFDFTSDRITQSVSMIGNSSVYGTAVYGTSMFGGQTDRSKLVFTKGNGKFIQFLLKNNNSGEAFGFNRFEVPVKLDAPAALK